MHLARRHPNHGERSVLFLGTYFCRRCRLAGAPGFRDAVLQVIIILLQRLKYSVRFPAGKLYQRGHNGTQFRTHFTGLFCHFPGVTLKLNILSAAYLLLPRPHLFQQATERQRVLLRLFYIVNDVIRGTPEIIKCAVCLTDIRFN